MYVLYFLFHSKTSSPFKPFFQDLHSYVVTEDGRTYTALSKISPQVGTEMQSLTPVGTPIAWLFAQPLRGAQNGFTLTGGKFNYTADVTFVDTGHSATVRLNFKVGLCENIIMDILYLCECTH